LARRCLLATESLCVAPRAGFEDRARRAIRSVAAVPRDDRAELSLAWLLPSFPTGVITSRRSNSRYLYAIGASHSKNIDSRRWRRRKKCRRRSYVRNRCLLSRAWAVARRLFQFAERSFARWPHSGCVAAVDCAERCAGFGLDAQLQSNERLPGACRRISTRACRSLLGRSFVTDAVVGGGRSD
jgi:hypothetical protein